MFCKYFFAVVCILSCSPLLYADEVSIAELQAVLEVKNTELEVKNKEIEQLIQENTARLQTIRNLQKKDAEQQKHILIRDAANKDLLIKNKRNQRRLPAIIIFCSGGLAVSMLHTVFNIPIDLSGVWCLSCLSEVTN